MSIKIFSTVEKLRADDVRVHQLSGDNDGIIAGYYDKVGNPSLFMSGASATLGFVGIKTDTPNEALTVTGNISATGFLSQQPNVCVLSLPTDQTLTAGVDAILNLTAKNDPNGWYVSANKSARPTSAGYYNVIGMVNFKPASSSNNQMNIQIIKNNGATIALAISPTNVGQPSTLVAQATVYCNGTTDEVKIQAYSGHNNGQTVTGTADGNWTKLEVFKIS